MLLLVLAIVILGLLLKKYVAQREQFSIQDFESICVEAKASEYKYKNGELNKDDGEVNENIKDYCDNILGDNTIGVNLCDTCSIKKDDEGNMTGCTRKFTIGEGDKRQEMDVSCTNMTSLRCNVCKEWEESDEFKTTMSDDEYKEYMKLPPKDGTPPSSNGNGNNNGSAPSTLTSSLRNLNNVLTQKLAGDSLSISSNNVSSASSVLTKLDELLQQGDMEQVNNFRNFSYSGGLEDPLPIDSSISSLSGDSELSTFNSQYTRFL